MRVTFTIPGPPQGKARARTFYNSRLGRMQSITPDKTVLYENLIKACWMEQTEGKRFPDGASLTATIIAYFEIPKSTPKCKKSYMQKGKLLPIKKPDIDNIIKTILDALNGVAYHDDTQVTQVVAMKFYVGRDNLQPEVCVTIGETYPEEGNE